MEITVNVTGLDNLANAIFALAKAAGNCKEETQVDATKVTPAVQQAVAPTATTTTVPSTPPVQNYSPYQQHRLHKRRPWHKIQHPQLVRCRPPQQPLHIQWNS